MHTMTLHAQADLWQHGAATFAALFMEGEMRSPDTEVDRTDVLLFVGRSLGLCDHTCDHTQGHQANPGPRSPQAAERGELAAGAITYPRQQRETRPAGGRAAGEYRRRPATLPRATTAAYKARWRRSRLVRSSG